jgi:Immunity protein 8
MSTLNNEKIELAVLEAFSPDVPRSQLDFDFASEIGYEAANPKYVQFVLLMTIGEKNGAVANNFQVIVTTDKNKFQSDKYSRFLHFDVYSWSELRETILSIIEKCSMSNWDFSVIELRKYFRWEFENYMEAS